MENSIKNAVLSSVAPSEKRNYLIFKYETTISNDFMDDYTTTKVGIIQIADTAVLDKENQVVTLMKDGKETASLAKGDTLPFEIRETGGVLDETTINKCEIAGILA